MTIKAAFIAVLSTAAVAGPATAAAGAATNGRIAFERTPEGSKFSQIYTIAPDGSDLRRITHVPGDPDIVPGAIGAAWSPDGSTVAFAATGTKQKVNLFTVEADGGAPSELPLDVGNFNAVPAYSPDGSKICFEHEDGPRAPLANGIFVADADGAGAQKITYSLPSEKSFDTGCQWSPDGTKIAFARIKNERKAAVFVVNADGSGLTQLTPYDIDAGNPDWSPDGSAIVFNSYYDSRRGKSSRLYTVPPGGGSLSALTPGRHGRLQSFLPSWSPDGTLIVFDRFIFRGKGHGYRLDLYTMAPDGSGRERLTDLPHDRPWDPDWGTAP